MTTLRVLTAGALVLLTAAGAAAKPGTIAFSTANLRAGPDAKQEIVAKIPGGTSVEVGECTKGWCAVTFGEKSGFVIQTALNVGNRPVVRDRPVVKKKVVRRRPPTVYELDDEIEPAP